MDSKDFDLKSLKRLSGKQNFNSLLYRWENMDASYKVIIDETLIISGLKILANPDLLTIEFLEKKYHDLVDCINFIELLVQFDEIYVNEFAYNWIKKWLCYGESSEFNSGFILGEIYSIKVKEKADIVGNKNSLKSLLFDSGVLKKYTLENFDYGLIAKNPYSHALDRAISNSYQADYASHFMLAYRGHLINPDYHLRLSHTGMCYLRRATGFHDVKPTITKIESIMGAIGSEYSAVIKELSQQQEALPLYSEKPHPFLFHLVLSKAKSKNRIVDAIVEIRNEMKNMRKRMFEYETIIADSSLSLKERYKANKAIDKLCEEASKPFEIIDFVGNTCWQDFMRDLWMVPKNMFDGITEEDFEGRNVMGFLLKYPIDLLIHVIKKRRLCNIPSMKAHLISNPEFAYIFNTVFEWQLGKSDIQGIHFYERNNHINNDVQSFLDNPDRMSDL